MIAQRIWSFIKNNKVMNIIVCDNYALADSLAKSSLGEEAFAVEITQVPTSIGDSYANGIFTNKDGVEISPLPTAEEEVATLKSEKNILEQQVNELTLAIAGMMARIS